MTYIEALQDAIRKMHGCESRHVESVPVKETFRGQTVWKGAVEVFDLIGHPRAKQCYSWGYSTGKDSQHARYLAVLRIPPVDSPIAAVRVSITSDHKQSETT